MRLSIIIPVYNVEQYLADCLQSVTAQDIPKNEYEIIVINDGSTDNSKKILEEASNCHSNILFIDQPNGGVSSARNKGLDNVRGEYILFIDSDDRIDENSISDLLDFAEKNNTDLLQFENRIIRDKQVDSPLPCCSQPTLFETKEDYLKTCFFSKRIWHVEMWRFLFKRTLIEDNGIRFNREISMGEDQLFSLRCISHAGKIGYTPQKIYNYLIRSGSAMTSFSHKHALSQLKSACEVKSLLSTTSKKPGEFETLFYQRFINIFVIYQYIDRLLSKDVIIPDKLRTINDDIRSYNLEKLYYIPYYKEENKNVTIYNTSIKLYCIYVQLKRIISGVLRNH
jgi:glycosyltransferase involved in cell wall biosynthesis